MVILKKELFWEAKDLVAGNQMLVNFARAIKFPGN